MKKIIALSAIFCASFAFQATAQNAYETLVKYDKANQNAVVAEYELPKEVIEAALKERFEKAGLGKPKNSKGFMTYTGKLWNEVSTAKLDVFAKVEEKKGKSTVQILVSTGNNNFITSGSDANAIQNVKTFMNSFLQDANAYQLKLDIEKQEEIVKKSEKEYNNAVDNGKDLAKEKDKIEKKILENTNEQSLKQRTLDEQRMKLETLKSRKS